MRELTSDSFENYSSLKYLYLANNFIIKLAPDVFSPLTDLEVLDLNHNFIKALPPVPEPLRRLYLDQNLIDNLTFPSAYNLQYLSLSMCELKKLPPHGMLPSLEELNITQNPLTELTPKDLAPLCRLKTLHLPTTLYQQPNYECDCHRLLTWTSQLYIDVGNFTCVKLGA